MPKHDSGTTNPKQSSRKNPSTDAIQMLKEDHRKVEALFDRFLEGEEGKKSQTAEQIFHELETHSTLEEELFYPAVQDPGGTGESASVDRRNFRGDLLCEAARSSASPYARAVEVVNERRLVDSARVPATVTAR